MIHIQNLQRRAQSSFVLVAGILLIITLGFTAAADSPHTTDPRSTSINSTAFYWDAFQRLVGGTPTASDEENLLNSTFIGGSGWDDGYSIAVDTSGCAYVTGYTSSSDFPTTAGAYDSTHNGGDYDGFVSKLSADGKTLLYSTYLGGSGWDGGYSIAVDTSGCAYVTGYTSSSDFPITAGAFDSTYYGGPDGFVSKLSADGNTLLYSTFLGGSYDDRCVSIAVDASGCAYVTGYTSSSDFPTTAGTYDSTYNGGTYDGFVSKLSADGNSLLYSTFLGGSDSDVGWSIAVDTSGCAYITGFSSDFPTTAGAYDTINNGGDYDGFVSKLSADGNTLIYSTFFGGTDTEYSYDITVDTNGCAYVTGATSSSDFPTTAGVYDSTHNGGTYDGFVCMFSIDGSALIYSTFVGGTINDYGFSIEVDANGCAYITGYTSSSDFPTTAGAYDSTYNGGDYDGFVSMIREDGSSLLYSTFFGMSGEDIGNSIAVDTSGCAYVTGHTSSSDFPTTAGAYDSTYNGGDYDGFVSKLNLVEYQPPGIPTLNNINPNPSTTGNVTISWSSVVGATNYGLYRALSPITEVGTMTPISACFGTSYVDEGLTNGTYYYAVVATNSNGGSGISNCVAVIVTIPQTPEYYTPNPPTLNNISPNPSTTGNVTISWSSAVGATSYALYRASAPIVEVGTLTPISACFGTNYVDEGLTNGTYYYAVVAMNSSGESRASNCVAVMIAIPPPETPEGESPNEEDNSDTPNSEPDLSLWDQILAKLPLGIQQNIVSISISTVGGVMVITIILKNFKGRKGKNGNQGPTPEDFVEFTL